MGDEHTEGLPHDFADDPVRAFLGRLRHAVAGGFTGMLATVAVAALLAVVTPARGTGAFVVASLLALAPIVGIVTGVMSADRAWPGVRRRLVVAAVAAAVALLLMQSGLNAS